jgi:hypothetical protein
MKQDFNALSKYETACFHDEESFLNKFGKGDCWQLLDVYFSSTSMKIVYVLWDGQHISDSYPIDEFIEWYKGN